MNILGYEISRISIFSAIFSGLLLLLVVIVGSTYLYEEWKPRFNVTNSIEEKIILRPGDDLVFERRICFLRDVEHGEVYRQITGDMYFNYGVAPLILRDEVGSCNDYEFRIVLPEDIRPGFYNYELKIVTTSFNLFQHVYSAPNVSFVILTENGDYPIASCERVRQITVNNLIPE